MRRPVPKLVQRPAEELEMKAQRTYMRGFLLLAAVFVVAIMAMQIRAGLSETPRIARAISTVLVSDDTGHGSGVHIGHGFILTAAHVVEDHEDMTITDSLGHKQPGKVLWSNKPYDVALLHVDHTDADSTPLNCTVHPKVGDAITAVGNPFSLGLMHSWGHIAAGVEERERFRSAFLADMTIAPGMSGGGVFDKSGNLVGLSVAFVTAGPFGYAISYIVPVSAACHLMGRI
jgi:S1-C subfamily serine protease